MMSESGPHPSTAPSLVNSVLHAADAAADTQLAKLLAYDLNEKERRVILPRLTSELQASIKAAAAESFASALGVGLDAAAGTPAASAAESVTAHVDELLEEATRQLREAYELSDEERDRRRYDAGEMGVVESMMKSSERLNPAMLQEKVMTTGEISSSAATQRGWFDGLWRFLDTMAQSQARASFHNTF
eukprot:CAMPEP_0198320902 /NCGR_PEP_ID=MMETSP1450-20131203/9715_1 /TAXON_ID=753684 ORGANISM="Madagascaria erythrocladiodes, Strain CCMP3234" /NCGR_SAMPLE_ID=MMETSP1450 /ASSEMBLY_ACC=CAM_ASM_001115 /LENGTH=188 /DNA_ID=CAMNT_0044024405 /DNA_START=122 /DNA_END=688 /DNA_ORIENTATION=+